MRFEAPTTSFERQEIEEKSYVRAQKIFEEFPPINPREFTDYDQRLIEKDEATVTALEKQFAEEAEKNPEQARNRKLAGVMEALIFTESELSDWLGEDAITIRPSKYDDYVNGVDIIVEFRKESAPYLALAVDVTTSAQLERKFDRIRREIDSDSPPRVKYFHSEFSGVRGSINNVPRVVIGASRATLTQVGELWLGKNKEEKRALARHPLQIQILTEMKKQLATFTDYARKGGHKKTADTYERALASVSEIMEKKQGQIPNPNLNDDVFRAILEQTEKF